MRPSKIVRTMCPMSCHPTLCGMLAEVSDGKLVGVRGDEANPDSQGFLCVRGQASREVIDNPARLLHPLIRDHRRDEFRRATWDEALDRVVAGMGIPEAVGIWPGHGTFTTNYGTRINSQLLARFANFHGSQLWSSTMICSEQRHDAAFVAKHTVGFDRLAAHVRAYPPAWAAERTGYATERIVTLARRYADTPPAMIVLGGSSMYKGANGWLAGRAIACLPALTGNVGIAGGGFGPRHGSRPTVVVWLALSNPDAERRGRSFPTRCRP